MVTLFLQFQFSLSHSENQNLFHSADNNKYQKIKTELKKYQYYVRNAQN